MKKKIEYKQLPFEIKGFDEETGVFEGYASTWDVDLGRDKVVKGAFQETLETKDFNQIDILYGHDDDLIIGELLEAKEDDVGLYIKAKLFVNEIQKAAEVKFLMDKGKLSKMSIGYVAENKSYNGGVRNLEKINLIEISVVKKPMNTNASITSVKSVDDLPEFKSLAEVEEYLKYLGCSNNAATAIVAEIKRISDEGEPHEEKSEQGDPEEDNIEPDEVHEESDAEVKEALDSLSKILKEMKG